MTSEILRQGIFSDKGIRKALDNCLALNKEASSVVSGLEKENLVNQLKQELGELPTEWEHLKKITDFMTAFLSDRIYPFTYYIALLLGLEKKSGTGGRLSATIRNVEASMSGPDSSSGSGNNNKTNNRRPNKRSVSISSTSSSTAQPTARQTSRSASKKAASEFR